jgi:hypothetical protein
MLTVCLYGSFFLPTNVASVVFVSLKWPLKRSVHSVCCMRAHHCILSQVDSTVCNRNLGFLQMLENADLFTSAMVKTSVGLVYRLVPCINTGSKDGPYRGWCD